MTTDAGAITGPVDGITVDDADMGASGLGIAAGDETTGAVESTTGAVAVTTGAEPSSDDTARAACNAGNPKGFAASWLWLEIWNGLVKSRPVFDLPKVKTRPPFMGVIECHSCPEPRVAGACAPATPEPSMAIATAVSSGTLNVIASSW